jgi:hypothetical protein
MHTPEHAAPTGAGRPTFRPRAGHAPSTPRTRPTAPPCDAAITGIAGADEEQVTAAARAMPDGTVPAAPLHGAEPDARNRPRRALPLPTRGTARQPSSGAAASRRAVA